MIQRLFVYGTLAPGKPNEHILSKIQGSWQDAAVKGVLHDKGWGAEIGYPAITLSNEGTNVNGKLFSSPELSNHWLMLDEFEGQEYERVLTLASIENNQSVETYIYVIKHT